MAFIWYFLFYSWLGFLIEVAFARLTHGKKQNRKCMLLLPLCPVYGVGAVGILLLPQWVRERPLALVLGAALVSTGAEYLLSWAYERGWGVSFWDYSALPLQLNGRICLPFALAWGLLGLPLVYLVQPVAAYLGSLLPEGVVGALGLHFLIDLALPGRVLRASHTTDALRWWATEPPAG